MKKVVFLIKFVLPPLLMTPIIFFPFDMASAIFWLGAFVLSIKSAVNIIKAVFSRWRKNEGEKPQTSSILAGPYSKMV